MPSDGSESLSQQRYSQYANGYITSETHSKGEDLERLIQIARPRKEWTVLDVATGGGHTALRFAPYVTRVIATDITPRMLQAAQAFIAGQGARNVAYAHGDAESLPFEAGVFDLVTCRIAPHHFSDVQRFVRECARVLEPGGQLLIQDHVLPENDVDARYVDAFERLRDPSHRRAFNETEWRALFRRAGLAVEHAEQLIKEHSFESWVKRQGCTPAVIERLVAMLDEAPLQATEWLEPRNAGTPEATFVNHHIIIAGRLACGLPVRSSTHGCDRRTRAHSIQLL